MCLRPCASGEEIVYSVREDGITGYEADKTEAADGDTITNTYCPEPTSIVLAAEKKVIDVTGGAKDLTFTFELLGENGEVIETVTREGAGKVEFTEITYESVGTYEYVIRETAGEEPGWSYDITENPVTVEVKDNGEGKLVAEVTKGDDIVIENYYEAEPVEVTLTADKVLTGRDLAEGEFTFRLLHKGEVLSEGTNAADGSITFEVFTLKKAGTYKFTMVEIAGDDPDVTYDTNVYTVMVTVTDDGNSNLTAKQDTEVTFTNKYEKEEPPVEPDEPDEPGKVTPDKPATGDETNVPGALALMGLALGAAFIAGTRRKDPK